MLNIDDNRLKHMRSVTELMYQFSRHLFNNTEKTARKHYLIGFTHDIGYRFSEHQRQHEHIGANILKSVGASIADTLSNHGEPTATMDEDLLLLNMCDMLTSKDGHYITFDERLADIADRYGSDSEQYVRANQVIRVVEDMLEELNITLPTNLTEWVKGQ